MALNPSNQPHIWRFFRAGGFDQVRIDRGSDIAALPSLDQKLWVALACPTRGVEFDERTLDLIDTDQDGRIRAPELIAAANWTVRLIKDPEELTAGRVSLPLAAIDDSGEDGRAILASARTILQSLAKPGEAEISLQDTLDIERIYNATPFNGDGIITADAAPDTETKAAIEAIIACAGAEIDRSGKPGISQASLERFFADAATYLAWQGEAAAILPLGDKTEAADAILDRLAAKLDDYFTRCRLAAYDGKAADALNAPLDAYIALAGRAIGPGDEEIAKLPLARVEAERALPLAEGINPAWSDAVERVRQSVIAPLLGDRASLAAADWESIKARFAPYDAWRARKPPTVVEKLGTDTIRTLVAADLRPRIEALIARDQALEPEMRAIADVEKLLRYQRDLAPLLNNFVSFRDFYTRRGKALFQAGTLYLDGRSCELCVRVEDEAAHATLASLARTYLVYCRCTRKGDVARMTIAAAFTAGDSDNLMVGRNGIFYDRKGRDWDATIVKIVENPISIRQSFWQPYRQAARMINGQIQKFAAARSAAVQTQIVARALETGGAAPAPAAAAVPPGQQAFDAARFAGIFAAIGLAIGAIGTAIASVVTGFLQLSWWQMPIAIVGILLVISGPSVLIAILKLRSRNLGPILDACGWAVNARLKINLPFGGALTSLARLPDEAERSLSDPYAEKRRPWGVMLAALVIAAAAAGLVWVWYFTSWLGR